MGLEINKEMLPMKAQYFLFNAGTAPIVPFLPTYARQLGFSSVIVGIIYTVLPVAGMLAKPIFGAIADRLKRQKTLFLIFQIVTIIAFFNIQFVPEIGSESHTQLDCGAETFFKVCSEEQADKCAADRIINNAGNIGTVHCEATCNVTDLSLWNELCTSWLVPEYCIDPETPLKFDGAIPMKRIQQVQDCVYFNVHSATFDDGTSHVPYCNQLYSTPCKLQCDNPELNKLLVGSNTDLDCNIESNFKICKKGSMDASKKILDALGTEGTAHCKAECALPSPQLFHEVCSSWKVPQYCSNKMRYPKTWKSKTIGNNPLEFTMDVPIGKTLQEGSCIYFRVNFTTFPDGSTHIPYCNAVSSNPCQISCDNAAVNEVLRKPATNDSQVFGLYQFWLFFLLVLISWVGMAVVVSIGDAICFEMLGPNHSNYGRQRLWGAVGWGSLSIITGLLVDEFSKGQTMKDYTVIFYLMLLLLLLNLLASSRLKYKQTKMSNSIVRDVGKLLGELRVVVFLLWCIFVGLCTAMVWNFLFWHLEDLALSDGCGGQQYTKTLQGLVMGIQSFGGELPFFFLSGWIINKIGHVHAMSLVLLSFGIRFILYSYLVDPWWCLPIELLQGITFGIFYATMASYASIVAPKGTEATVQGLVGAVFEGIGVSLGSLLGGVLYKGYGGAIAFRIYGIAAFIMCALHIVYQYVYARCRPQGTATTTHYASPNEAFHMLDDHQTVAQ